MFPVVGLLLLLLTNVNFLLICFMHGGAVIDSALVYWIKPEKFRKKVQTAKISESLKYAHHLWYK